MKIRVRLFARYRELTGTGQTDLTIKPGCTVAVFVSEIASSFPGLKGVSGLAVAVNGDFAAKDLVLKNGDEVALLPPLSGG